MPDRHKIKPMTLRLPEGLSAWLAARAEAESKPVRRLMLELLEAEQRRSTAR